MQLESPLWPSWGCCTPVYIQRRLKRIPRGPCNALFVPQIKVGRRLFALDCVTFQAEARTINPAPWTDRAGDTGPFILACTAPCLAADQRRRGGGRRKYRAEEKERGEGTEGTDTAIPHVYLWAWSLKSQTNDCGCMKAEDWFTNELFEDIAEDGRIFMRIREGQRKIKHVHPQAKERGEATKKTNKDLVVKRGLHDVQ